MIGDASQNLSTFVKLKKLTYEAEKSLGSGLKNRVGRVSGNTIYFFRPKCKEKAVMCQNHFTYIM